MDFINMHRWLAAGAFGALLVTGLYMATHFPAAYASLEAVRYMLRSNFELMAGLVNVVACIGLAKSRRG